MGKDYELMKRKDSSSTISKFVTPWGWGVNPRSSADGTARFPEGPGKEVIG